MKFPSGITRIAAAAVVGGAMTLGAVANTAQAQDSVRWRMPIAFPSTLPGLASPAPWVAKRLNEISDGSIQIRVSEPGKIVPPFDILDAVSDGKVSAGYTWVGYDQGKVPAIPLFAAVPFGMKPWAFMGWYYFDEGHNLVQEVYANAGYNVHAELCGIIGPETAGWYREPIESLDDYKGLKIRFAGLGGRVLEKLGASVTMMPGGELFQALETGTIDATEFSLPIIDQILGFNKVVKYNLFPGWHQQFTAQYMLINKDDWNALGENQRSQIDTACMAATTYALSESEAKNGKVLMEFQDKGVHTAQIPEPVLKELRATTREVMQEEASKNEDFKRVWESQKEFMKQYKVWGERAYLKPEMMLGGEEADN
ncbi:TRAP transporter substrate-binding protein [Arhodomonas aquaeolei]|uniref:TRAP transporter substrate-binding protein n=1 Tax=Arhodomonas aquaeolei TaxID=2369 RepID=UPI002168A276|nr:TRAP transporter substrate-binding protein [Arhodomonas aquaeolei]MCS4502943.1 TRAP transporter substrate-binding protein [Arhodomonas aquaeolei]